VAYVASRYAWQEETSNYEKSLAAAAKKKAGDSSRSSVLPVSNGGTANGSDLRTPLLNGDGGGASSSEAAPRGSGPAISRGGGSSKKMGEDQSKWEAWLTPKNKKDVLLFGSFLLCTVFQVFVGAKCVAFYFQVGGASMIRVRFKVSLTKGPPFKAFGRSKVFWPKCCLLPGTVKIGLLQRWLRSGAPGGPSISGCCITVSPCRSSTEHTCLHAVCSPCTRDACASRCAINI
jgi:hypothetical protein